MPQNCTVFLLPCRLTRSAIYHKWPTVLVHKVKGKPLNFEAYLCWSLYSTFKTSFYPYAFYNKRLQTLFKDQLDRSKAMCSFKVKNRVASINSSTWRSPLKKKCKIKRPPYPLFGKPGRSTVFFCTLALCVNRKIDCKNAKSLNFGLWRKLVHIHRRVSRCLLQSLWVGTWVGGSGLTLSDRPQ